MIDLKKIEKDATSYRENLVARKFSESPLDDVLALNLRRRQAITEAEQKKSQQRKVSEQIPQLKKKGEETSALMSELQKTSAEVKALEKLAVDLDQQVRESLLMMPNVLNPSVPRGPDESANQVMKTVGEPVRFSFPAKEHFDLGEKLQILDFERAGKVTGARFTFLRGAAARLERALIQFFMDLHSEQHGYEEMISPFMANSASFLGVGQFPKFVDDVFHVSGTDYHLIPTAEVTATNFFRDEILAEKDLPKSFCAFSPCFRSEAGSHGRDTKGLIRQHQFHKVELMTFSHPDRSYEIHEALTTHAERCLELLELPYRRMLLCSGDISFGAAKCYDLEVWLAGGQGGYREISSCSNFEDFQARRANIRFRDAGGKIHFVHTLNGSGLAVGRTLVAILENYQREDGSIAIPKVLHRYTNGLIEINPG